uniref:B30.2/SPRY domain-containing protein n=1 Tax=Arcella intermedia TaxID=1963864 RepID=A0A6B2LAY1_9EUKA
MRCILLLIEAGVLNEDIANIVKEFTKITESKYQRRVMDIIVYSLELDSPHKPQLLNIGKSFANQLEAVNQPRSVADWIPWLKMHVNGQTFSPESEVYFSPEKSIQTDISPDGLLCKGQDKNFGFTSAITNKCAKTGKWYFEVEMLSCGLFQIGFVTHQFKANPEDGGGVGDDEHSWAVDLYRNKKWHKEQDEEDPSKSYAIETKWKKGGILQCYLDVDNREMAFGYNGKQLGVAYSNFEIEEGLFPAFSSNINEECKFNFGSQAFRFPDLPEGYKPFNLSQNN